MVKYLKLNFVQTFFIFLKHRIKHFASVIVSAQVSSLYSSQETKHCKAGIHPACWYFFSHSINRLKYGNMVKNPFGLSIFYFQL
jgi:hypothetical protein